MKTTLRPLYSAVQEWLILPRNFLKNSVYHAFAPPDTGIEFENTSSESVRVLMYKQRYVPLGNLKPWIVFGDTNKIEENIYDEMDNVFLRDLLPNDLEFDMNMHTLKFMPDGCHPFVETHVQ